MAKGSLTLSEQIAGIKAALASNGLRVICVRHCVAVFAS